MTDGSGDAWAVFPLTVPPGGEVAIVHFLVLSGVDTGSLPGTTKDTHPADVGDVMAAILAGWGVDPVLPGLHDHRAARAVLSF